MTALKFPKLQLTHQELVTAIKPAYSHFLSSGHLDSKRLLLTGHSHQAWPDVARQGMIDAFEDAAQHVDDKWGAVFSKADIVRQDIASLTASAVDEIAIAQNTHELFSRFLSALPLKDKPLIIATDGEFHSVYRQLCALEQAGVIEVQWIPSDRADLLGEKIISALERAQGRCAAAITSSVLFQTGAIVPRLAELAQSCLKHDVRLFIDAYHSFKVVPFSLEHMGQAQSITYLSGGGYKYAQWGEGVCWLRVPKDDDLKPIFTGWFSDFSHLHQPRYEPTGVARAIRYGSRPADRFAGSTFDPTSLYRAVQVIDFFNQTGLDIDVLRSISLHQTQKLIDGLSPILRPITPTEDEARGGFVAFHIEHAQHWSRELRDLNVFTDARGNALRFGPAPYLSDDEIDETIERTLHLYQRKGL